MLQILDLSRDLPCFQAGLAQAAAFQQPVDLGVENFELMSLFAQLVIEGSVAEDLGQCAPIVELGNLLSEDVEMAVRPHE